MPMTDQVESDLTNNKRRFDQIIPIPCWMHSRPWQPTRSWWYVICINLYDFCTESFVVWEIPIGNEPTTAYYSRTGGGRPIDV